MTGLRFGSMQCGNTFTFTMCDDGLVNFPSLPGVCVSCVNITGMHTSSLPGVCVRCVNITGMHTSSLPGVCVSCVNITGMHMSCSRMWKQPSQSLMSVPKILRCSWTKFSMLNSTENQSHKFQKVHRPFFVLKLIVLMTNHFAIFFLLKWIH